MGWQTDRDPLLDFLARLELRAAAEAGVNPEDYQQHLDEQEEDED